MDNINVVRIEDGGPYFPDYDFDKQLADDLTQCLVDIVLSQGAKDEQA